MESRAAPPSLLPSPPPAGKLGLGGPEALRGMLERNQGLQELVLAYTGEGRGRGGGRDD